MKSVNTNLRGIVKKCSDFESLLKKLISHCAELDVIPIDQTITEMQRIICQSLEFDQSILWLFNEHGPEEIIRTHVYGSSEKVFQDNRKDEEITLPWIFCQIKKGKTLALEIPETLPKEAFQDKETLRKQGIKAIFAAPVTSGDSVIGILSFCCLQEKISWSKTLIRQLKLLAQIFSNALDLQQGRKNLQERLRFESLIADLSFRFVNLNADQLDSQIERAQESICKCLGIDLSAMWQWSGSAPHFLTITHLYSVPGGPELPTGIDGKKAFPWVYKRTIAGEVSILYTEKMPPEAGVDQESRRSFGVKSSVVVPLCSGEDRIIGLLSFDALREEKFWSEQIVGRLVLVGQIFTNALARKRGELKLRENEKRLLLASGAAQVGLWVMDLNSKHVWATPETRKIFQFEPAVKLNYNHFIEKIIEPDRGVVDQAVQEATESGKTMETKYRILLSDASVRWVSTRGKVSYDNTGKPHQLMGTSIDITNSKQMEVQLQTQLDEIRTLKQGLEKQNKYLQQKIDVQYVHEEIIARGDEMKQVLGQMEQVAQTEATVLIEGETGTGKELVARAVHRLSNRNDLPMITVNCASLPPTLVESELFGREKGAYTGAMTKMAGRFEVADKATIFLDEVGELPLEIQAKLLRVLEQGSFERLGSTQTIQVDVRIIAATNKDLETLVSEGKFRKDLYFRLNIFPLYLPLLKDRIEDIPSLTWAFVREYEKKMGKRIDNIPHKCMDDLQQYPWPGNIRELRNVIERAFIVSKGRTLLVKVPCSRINAKMDNDLSLEEMERRYVTSVLQSTEWRISGKGSAAEILGLKRTTLQSKMKKLGIQRL